MSSKISALTDGTTAQASDRLPVSRAGANRFITPAYIAAYTASVYGLMARAETAANIDYTDGSDTIVNFATVQYDPGSDITTGASWHYTAPADGWYDVRIVCAFVRPQAAAWADGAAIEFDVYVNGTFLDTLTYWESGGWAGTDTWLGLNGSRAVQLSASDTVHIQCYNGSGATRRLSAGAGVEIYRVA